MRELIDKGFVVPTEAVAWYWLNPDYLWNGDRLAFVREFRRKGASLPTHAKSLCPLWMVAKQPTRAGHAARP